MNTYQSSSLQECLNALQAGQTVTCWDQSTLVRRADGTYVYRPFLTSPLVAIRENETTCPDLLSLLAFIVLREATYDRAQPSSYAPPRGLIIESNLVRSGADTSQSGDAKT